MERDLDFYEKVERIVEKDPRFKMAAYGFVMLALNYTLSKLDRPRHVTGRELLDGIRKFGLDQYGPMTKTVFNYWGVQTTRDFGEIVFNLVTHNLLGKTEEDNLEDFVNIYDFEEEFVKRYPW
ncbi:MAG: Minf_1886 family protein [Candidatus Eisenbacteria bacterium]